MAETEKLNNSVFIYTEDFNKYKFSDQHPFNPLRIRLTYELLKASGALDPCDILTPRIATDEEILAAHSGGYVNFINHLSMKCRMKKNSRITG